MSNSLLYSSRGFDPSGSDDNAPEETKQCCYCKAPVDTDGEACTACIEANKADDEWWEAEGRAEMEARHAQQKLNEQEENNIAPLVVEMIVRKWKHTDKYPCPKCGAKLGMPDYKCEQCNVKLKLKMKF